mmetsp:Transcript_17533/g.42793  ORF Transcript_17533/g.42793 Transcript_17533/m.42793 type:complete len:80 (-) Transcript_17533:70-309(-)
MLGDGMVLLLPEGGGDNAHSTGPPLPAGCELESASCGCMPGIERLFLLLLLLPLVSGRASEEMRKLSQPIARRSLALVF